jgi:8-oxo-dGTP pyrophosphatase MutT (NUDIX family)
MDIRNRSWMFRQSGVVPVRRAPGGARILLISSRRGKHWVIPKGIIEPHLTPEESALREAYEEAGVRGELRGESLGYYTYRKWGGTCHVQVFVLEVIEELPDWPESGFRERMWVSPAEAAQLVDQEGLRRLLDRIPERPPGRTEG